MSKPQPQIQSQEQALGIIFKGLDVAQSKGAFTLEEASILSAARSLFLKEEPSPPQPPPTEGGEEESGGGEEESGENNA